MTARQFTTRRRVLIVTGSRAEFGLLRPVMDAIRRNRRLELRAAVAGEHLLGPAFTWKEAAHDYRIDAKVPMQRPRDRGRLDHAAACGRGIVGFAAAFKKIKPDWVVVLGDRIEAFAAASAASIGGIAVCHVHGGDRAEGIADEAMRHAITKMSHLHCAATKRSAERIRAMGEDPASIHITGSPAMDGLARIKPMNDAGAKRIGDPRIVLLLHPSGFPAEDEAVWLTHLVAWAAAQSPDHDLLVLMPNSDPGAEQIRRNWRALSRTASGVRVIEHLSRATFVSLLRRLAVLHASGEQAFLLGNSSTGLVEGAALGVPVINVGPRQAGRERGENVVDVPAPKRFRDADGCWLLWPTAALDTARIGFQGRQILPEHAYGDGRAGPRIAALLAKTNPHDPALLRKRNSY